MQYLSGTFRNSLDEKARLTLPARLRETLGGDRVVITQGLEHCLWLFPAEYWEGVVQKIMERTSLFNENSRRIQRWLIAPSQEMEIDKAGRVSLPQALRDYAKIGEGRECVVAGVIKRVEIWDAGSYQDYWADDSRGMTAIVEQELGDIGL